MILGDRKIRKAITKGDIVIKPFDDKCIGPNSYDVHLGRWLTTYVGDELLDAKVQPKVKMDRIPDEGFILEPGELYLGSTVEWTNSKKHLPKIEGKSSIGRLGIAVHITAGLGDVGFAGHWTLEIFALKRVRVYYNMKIAQIFWHKTTKVDVPYGEREGSKYQEQHEHPVPSKMWMNFVEPGGDI